MARCAWKRRSYSGQVARWRLHHFSSSARSVGARPGAARKHSSPCIAPACVHSCAPLTTLLPGRACVRGAGGQAGCRRGAGRPVQGLVRAPPTTPPGSPCLAPVCRVAGGQACCQRGAGRPVQGRWRLGHCAGHLPAVGGLGQGARGARTGVHLCEFMRAWTRVCYAWGGGERGLRPASLSACPPRTLHSTHTTLQTALILPSRLWRRWLPRATLSSWPRTRAPRAPRPTTSSCCRCGVGGRGQGGDRA